MKRNKKILNVFPLARKIVIVAAMFVFCFANPLMATKDNGCDDPNNGYINPVIALCSTHAYNIGGKTNPDNDETKEYMKEIIGLKATVIAQQMKKQYDYLDRTLQRFKIQLEKAVLTSKLEDAQQNTPSGQSGSNDNDVVLSGAENCSAEALKSGIVGGLSCIIDNITLTLDAIDSGNVGQAKRQLAKDLEFAKRFGIDHSKDGDCNSTNREKLKSCAYTLSTDVMRKRDSENRQNKSQRMPAYYMQE